MLAMASGNVARAQEAGRGEKAFEVTSVKRHDPNVRTQNMQIAANGIVFADATLYDCIKMAYGLADYQIRDGGSDEVVTYRYDLTGKAADTVSRAELKAMLRSMLAQRFALKTHIEKKEMAAYALVLGADGPKLKVTASQGESVQRISLQGVSFQRTSMAALADFLSGLESIDRPVLDMTGLDGLYDFELRLSSENRSGDHAIYAWESILGDIRQIGLKLNRTRGAIAILVIDHAEKPSEN